MQLSKHFKLKEFIKSQIQAYPNKMAKFDKIGITKYKLIPPGLESQQRTVTMYKRNRKLLTGVEDETE